MELSNATPILRILDEAKAREFELLLKDYKFSKPGVQQTPWETREMTIVDPFRNRLIFAERLTRVS